MYKRRERSTFEGRLFIYGYFGLIKDRVYFFIIDPERVLLFLFLNKQNRFCFLFLTLVLIKEIFTSRFAKRNIKYTLAKLPHFSFNLLIQL